jgi:hypothetical protein
LLLEWTSGMYLKFLDRHRFSKSSRNFPVVFGGSWIN